MRLDHARIRQHQMGLGLALIAFLWLSLLALKFAAPLAPALPRCAMYSLVKIPCPTCGTTRALLACAQGQFAAALALNPLVIALYVSLFISAFLLMIATVMSKNMMAFLCPQRMAFLRRLAAVALGANWIYLLARESMK